MLRVILIFLISMPAWANWALKRDYGKTVIYTSKNKTRLTINYSTTPPRKKKMDLKLAKYVEDQKKKMLEFVNIKDWTVSDRKLEKRDDYTLIKISGSYVNQSQEKIFFTEYHFYKFDRRLQALMTHTDKKELAKDDNEEMLQGFKIKYGI